MFKYRKLRRTQLRLMNKQNEKNNVNIDTAVFHFVFVFQLLFLFDIVSFQWNYATAVIAIILISQSKKPNYCRCKQTNKQINQPTHTYVNHIHISNLIIHIRYYDIWIGRVNDINNLQMHHS